MSFHYSTQHKKNYSQLSNNEAKYNTNFYKTNSYFS